MLQVEHVLRELAVEQLSLAVGHVHYEARPLGLVADGDGAGRILSATHERNLTGRGTMSWWRNLFGGGPRPEETMRLTRRVMDLFAEGKSDEEAERALYREGVPVERARSIVAEVRQVQRRMRGG
jgi:hypothetical protein